MVLNGGIKYPIRLLSSR